MGRPTLGHREFLHDFLQSPSTRRAFIREALEQGNVLVARLALRDLVEATSGFTRTAAALGTTPGTLSRALSYKGNPSLDLIVRLLDFHGMRLSAEPKRQTGGWRAAEGKGGRITRQPFPSFEAREDGI